MNKLTASVAALPFRELGRRPDFVLALVVAFIIAMLIIPMPTLLLDGLIAVNIACGMIVLLVVLFAKGSLELSSFPSLLLVTTLFRLGLNVSTTRGILSNADAGDVVRAFGQFVTSGDIVVGLVMFLVITIVQFLVIGKGAERVAEVAARFTLDAMPGKQMSIDADLRAGSIDETEARSLREELGRESQMYGNMDGAMKFVKGDAIAGLIITALNMVAGFIIGVSRNGMALAAAAELYTILTIGDGVVSQISALLITLAAGVLVTRVAAKDGKSNLGFVLRAEIVRQPKVMMIAAFLLTILGLVPGLPMLPFVGIAAILVLGTVAGQLFAVADAKAAQSGSKKAQFDEALAQKVAQAKAQKSLADKMAPTVLPVCIEIDPRLSRVLGFDGDGQPSASCELINTFAPQLRDALFLETGVRFPGVRVQANTRAMPPCSFTIKIKDVPVVHESFPDDACLAMTSPRDVARLGVDAEPHVNPLSGTAVAVIALQDRDVVESGGVNVWSPAGVIALYLAQVLRQKAREFIGLQEVSDLVDRLEQVYPALVKEVVPKVVALPQLVDVLRRLADEGVSIRDLKTILEALGEHGAFENDGVTLTEMVRSQLSSQLAFSYAGLENRLSVVLLDPIIEETVADAIRCSGRANILALAPEVAREIIDSVEKAVAPAAASGLRPAVLTSAEIRRYVRKLLEGSLPNVAVLSYEELPSDLTVQPLGRAQLA